MNQKEIKLLVLLFLLPFWFFQELLLFSLRCIIFITRIFARFFGYVADSSNDYKPLISQTSQALILIFIASAFMIAAIVSKSCNLDFWYVAGSILLVMPFLFLAYQIYLLIYFRSENFGLLKASVNNHAQKCNELNERVNELSLTNLEFSSSNYGDGSLIEQSNFRFRRQEWSKLDRSATIHHCSSTVLKNASNQPFKYMCKYFNIEVNDETLASLESSLNDLLAAEQGKLLLELERERIINEMESPPPLLMLRLSKEKVMRELGFDPVSFNNVNYPSYTFRYVSSGGNSSYDFNLQLDIANLEKFIIYLGDIINLRRSVKGQRALMTQYLREKIKCRDNYTCKFCGASIQDERNLLLEIDHIIPLSKGGITTEDNLQTLCWRCNRAKGAKLLHFER